MKIGNFNNIVYNNNNIVIIHLYFIFVYYMSKINLLITGGLGFIGHNFINYIFDTNNYTIIVLDNESNCFDISSINKDIRDSKYFIFINGSYGNKKLVKKILKEYKITYVINLAATTFELNKMHTPIEYVENNISNLTNFLEVCHEYGKLDIFLHMSTYLTKNIIRSLGTVNIFCINEYIETKGSGLGMVVLYRDKYKLPVIIGFSNNIFGKNQCLPNKIHDYLTLLKNDKKIPIEIHAIELENYIYIDNVVTAFEIILKRGSVGVIYRIITDINDDGYKCDLDLARSLICFFYNTGNYNKWIKYINNKTCRKIEDFGTNEELKELGWKISVSTTEGLKIVADSYKK